MTGKNQISKVRDQLSESWALILIFLFAFTVRIVWMLVAQPIPISDFAQYLENARDLVDFGSYGYPDPTAYRLPLYPLVLAGLLLIKDSVIWLSLWSVTMSTVICLLVFLVAVRFGTSRQVGLTAAFVCAIYPQFVFFSPVLASEHLLAVLFLSSLLIIAHPGLGLTSRFALAGVLVGASVLTRGDGAIYGVIVLIAGLTWAARRESARHTFAQGLKHVAVFGLVSLLTVTPWLVRNHIVMGPGTLLGGNAGQAFWYGHNPQGYGFIAVADTPLAGLSEIEMQERAWELGIAYIRRNPSSLVSSTISGTAELLAPSRQEYGLFWSTRDASRATQPGIRDSYDVLAGLARAGAWFLTIVPALVLVSPRVLDRRLLFLAVAVVAANWFFYAVVFLGNPRYRFMTDVMLCIVTGAVLVGLRKAPSGTRARWRRRARLCGFRYSDV